MTERERERKRDRKRESFFGKYLLLLLFIKRKKKKKRKNVVIFNETFRSSLLCFERDLKEKENEMKGDFCLLSRNVLMRMREKEENWGRVAERERERMRELRGME